MHETCSMAFRRLLQTLLYSASPTSCSESQGYYRPISSDSKLQRRARLLCGINPSEKLLLSQRCTLDSQRSTMEEPSFWFADATPNTARSWRDVVQQLAKYVHQPSRTWCDGDNVHTFQQMLSQVLQLSMRVYNIASSDGLESVITISTTIYQKKKKA